MVLVCQLNPNGQKGDGTWQRVVIDLSRYQWWGL